MAMFLVEVNLVWDHTCDFELNKRTALVGYEISTTISEKDLYDTSDPSSLPKLVVIQKLNIKLIPSFFSIADFFWSLIYLFIYLLVSFRRKKIGNKSYQSRHTTGSLAFYFLQFEQVFKSDCFFFVLVLHSEFWLADKKTR